MNQAHFTSLHAGEDLGGGRHRLTRRLGYYSPVLKAAGINRGWVWMERGFEHDGYSGPWLAAPLLWRLPLGPAALHDKLCTPGAVPGVTRALADAVILEAMEAAGISWWRRRLVYRGTRIGDHLDIGGQGDEYLQRHGQEHTGGEPHGDRDAGLRAADDGLRDEPGAAAGPGQGG